MELAIKTTLAKNDPEAANFERNKRSHLRMVSNSAARLRFKRGRSEEIERATELIEANRIRMYDTHVPGFCYLRNGEYRKKIASQSAPSTQDPTQCSEKIKAILFTDNELDVYKTMCLHLLATHIQNKNHIQRKDGRLCSYVKAQSTENSPQSLQPILQRIANHMNNAPTKYDKILPRYILDIKVLHSGISTLSFKTSDLDSGSDDETNKKRKHRVPIYINNDIRMIINSVMEALEAVESAKYKALIELASSPEELRKMLTNEDLQDFIYELARNPLVTRPTSYDYVMTHLVFDRIPEKGTLETIAQVLEVWIDSDLSIVLQRIRRGLLQRHIELANTNILPGRKCGIQDKSSLMGTSSKSSSINYSLKNSSTAIIKQELLEDSKFFKKDDVKHAFISSSEYENKGVLNRKQRNSAKVESRSVSINLEKNSIDEQEHSLQREDSADYNDMTDLASYGRSYKDSIESNKCDFYNLSNSQRILLGLKIASLKCKPINMHQFEGKKKIDIGAIITPIIRPQIADVNYKQNSPENRLRNFSLPEKKVKKSSSKLSLLETANLENLSRGLLTNLRLEISESENKKRLKKFIDKI